MIQIAIDSLCGALNNVPQGEHTSEEKAKIIGEFAARVSKEILRRAGFPEETSEDDYHLKDQRWFNEPARFIEDCPQAPADCFAELILNDVPSSLAATTDGKNTSLAFGKDRVVDYEGHTGKVRRIMTYEQTARYVIFWLQEKILQICRKNNWDRISGLPDLFDRIEAMTASLTQKPMSGEALQQKLGLPYNPADLLGDLHILGLPMKTYHTLLNSYATRDSGIGFRIKSLRLDYLVTLKRAEFQKVKNLGRKSINEFARILQGMGMDIGMTIPDEVKAWCEALAKEEPTE